MQSAIKKSVSSLVQLLSETPAECMNILGKKGGLKKGMDADFVVWNPFDIFTFDLSEIIENSNLEEDPVISEMHIFHKRKFYGGVVMTFLRGK